MRRVGALGLSVGSRASRGARFGLPRAGLDFRGPSDRPQGAPRRLQKGPKMGPRSPPGGQGPTLCEEFGPLGPSGGSRTSRGTRL
eukprot:2404862-Pyramimonas_sp.AAC.1